VHDDADQSVFVWLRRDAQGREVLVACNFTPVPRHGYRVGLPEASAAAWITLLNTDDERFGGSGQHNAGEMQAEALPHHGHARSLLLTLPPLATVFLGPT
jgi:1,4-alpha-glucan branching enzyme